MNKGIEGFANTSFENEEEYLDFNFPELYVDTIKIPKKEENGKINWEGTEGNNLISFQKEFFSEHKKLYELAKNHADLLAKGIEENYKQEYPEISVSVLSDDNVLKDTKFYINIKFGEKQVYPIITKSAKSIAA
ncbi:MAG: hypothetical protein KBF62_01250 [Candidatus Pacebacteria bacterium]|nr:hypothetical protein [Candidatus Paceibacterota bacterium]MBP9058246.1 hypothetical protein [Candidatus Paceibacterota bacterium]MBP9770188.1 hypothetical protein [Candidatus Paceibacterota bacterium]